MDVSDCVVLVGVFFSLLVILPWLFWRYFRNRRLERLRDDRRERNECVKCGYDLRAGHKICPECGAANAPEETPHPSSRDFEFDPRKLSGDWPNDAIAPRIPEPYEPRVIVHSTTNSNDASLLSQQLNARGVWSVSDVVEQREARGRIVQYDVVVVLAEDEAAAKAIIDQFRSSVHVESGQ